MNLFFQLPISMRRSYVQNVNDHFFPKRNLLRLLKFFFEDRTANDIDCAFEKTLRSSAVSQILAKQSAVNGALSHWKLICLGSFIRLLKPEVVVETGVAHGSSSAVILEALEEHGRGTLYSIDLPVFKSDDGELRPWLQGYSFQAGDVSTVRDLDQVGWLVPSYLRSRWKLILGDSLSELPMLISDLPPIDFFLHDSLHHGAHMTQEFELVWPGLKNGGFLFADDIFLKMHSAVPDFANRHGESVKSYLQLGIIRKAGKRQMARSSQEMWTRVWSRESRPGTIRLEFEMESKSVRWRKIRNAVLRKYGSIAGLQVIEIGSGSGTYGLLMALEGARITLFDQNESAFDRAKQSYDEWGQRFERRLADAFALPSDLMGRFDIAMSFGLAEHFKGPRRFRIFESHLRLLKPGGLLIVSVPNRAFLPYRIGKFLLEASGKWEFGLEIPFSHRELRSIAKHLGLAHWQVIGSGVIGDFANYWLIQRLLHLPHYLWENLLKRVQGKSGARVLALKDRFHYFPLDFESSLDDYCGYALVLVGSLPV